MPGLPGKQGRRKGATPISKIDQEDVWKRTLAILGLVPLTTNHHTNNNHSPMAIPGIPSPSPAAKAGEKTSILDLPSEVQKDIFRHVGSPSAAGTERAGLERGQG